MAGRFSFVALSALVLVGWAESHSLGWGRCSNIKGMKGFDKNQFLGKWYISEVFSAINSCMTLTFEAKPDVDNELTMSQGRHLAVVGSTTSYVGTVIIGDPVASEMLIKWPATGWLIGSQKYTVVDTDYTTYALTYECRNVGPIRYYSSTILTRQPTVDPTVMAEIKKKAADAGIRVSDYVTIDQVNCAASDSPTPNTAAYNHYGLVSDEKLVTIKNHEALIKEIGLVILHR